MKVLGLALAAFFLVLTAGWSQAPNPPIVDLQAIQPPSPPNPILTRLEGTWKAKLADSDNFKSSVWSFSAEELTIKQTGFTVTTRYTTGNSGKPIMVQKTKDVPVATFTPPGKGSQTVMKSATYNTFVNSQIVLTFEVLSQKWTGVIGFLDSDTMALRLTPERGDPILVVLCKERGETARRQ